MVELKSPVLLRGKKTQQQNQQHLSQHYQSSVSMREPTPGKPKEHIREHSKTFLMPYSQKKDKNGCSGGNKSKKERVMFGKEGKNSRKAGKPRIKGKVNRSVHSLLSWEEERGDIS